MYNLSQNFKASVLQKSLQNRSIYEAFELFLQCKWMKWKQEEKVK